MTSLLKQLKVSQSNEAVSRHCQLISFRNEVSVLNVLETLLNEKLEQVLKVSIQDSNDYETHAAFVYRKGQSEILLHQISLLGSYSHSIFSSSKLQRLDWKSYFFTLDSCCLDEYEIELLNRADELNLDEDSLLCLFLVVFY